MACECEDCPNPDECNCTGVECSDAGCMCDCQGKGE